MIRVPIQLSLLLFVSSAMAQMPQATHESASLRAKLFDPAAFIDKCDSAWLWRFKSDHPDDSGKSLSERILLGVVETTEIDGQHGKATVMTGLLHCGLGLNSWAFPAAVVADGPDTSVYFSCEPLAAISFRSERFADITGDGLPELVLDCHAGQYTWGLQILSLTNLDAVLKPLGFVDSISGHIVPYFTGNSAEVVETADSKLPVIAVYETHQLSRFTWDSTIHLTKTYYRYHDGHYELGRQRRWLSGGKDTVETVFGRSRDR